MLQTHRGEIFDLRFEIDEYHHFAILDSAHVKGREEPVKIYKWLMHIVSRTGRDSCPANFMEEESLVSFVFPHSNVTDTYTHHSQVQQV